MEEIAYAKINLALHVRARERDGYHRIETLFAFAEDGDRLSAAPAPGLSLAIDGPFAAGLGADDGNLVLRAARTLASRYDVRSGAALRLEKRLPIAAGIGGGSADAAAALRLLSRLWTISADPEALHEVAASLGADVPACLRSETMRGEGRGDRLVPAFEPGLTGTSLLLVNPIVPVPTGAVFAAWDGIDRGALGLDWRSGRNDLEAPAMHIAPVIGEVLAALHDSGGKDARMSGSGATCFALFDTRQSRDAAQARIMATFPHWWTMATRLR